jgi:hypothetical protein
MVLIGRIVVAISISREVVVVPSIVLRLDIFSKYEQMMAEKSGYELLVRKMRL